MCKQSMKEFYKQFINEPLPFESSLLNQTFGNALAAATLKTKEEVVSHFPDVLLSEICASERGKSLIELRNWLQLTFLFLRARRNPGLYGVRVQECVERLEEMSAEELALYAEEFRMYSNGLDVTRQPRHVLLDFFTVLGIYEILAKQLKLLFLGGLVRVGDAAVQEALCRDFFVPEVPEGYYRTRIEPTTAGLV